MTPRTRPASATHDTACAHASTVRGAATAQATDHPAAPTPGRRPTRVAGLVAAVGSVVALTLAACTVEVVDGRDDATGDAPRATASASPSETAGASPGTTPGTGSSGADGDSGGEPDSSRSTSDPTDDTSPTDDPTDDAAPAGGSTGVRPAGVSPTFYAQPTLSSPRGVLSSMRVVEPGCRRWS